MVKNAAAESDEEGEISGGGDLDYVSNPIHVHVFRHSIGLCKLNYYLF